MNNIRQSWCLLSILLLKGLGVLVAEEAISLQQGIVGYKEIGNLYLPSFGLNSSVKDDQKNEAVTFELASLSDRDKREIVYNLLATIEDPKDQAVITLIKDLEIFAGQGKNANAHIFSTINHTKTVFGEAVLSSILSNPIHDVTMLRNRQRLICELVENERLFQAVDLLLENVKKAENGFLSFWKDENQQTRDFIKKRLYFDKLKTLNTNPYALEASNRMANMGTALGIANPFVQQVFIKYVLGKLAAKSVAVMKERGLPVPDDVPADYSIGKAIQETSSFFKNLVNPFGYKKFYEDFKASLIQSGFEPESAQKLALGLGGMAGTFVAVATGYWMWNSKIILSEASTAQNAINYLHTRLIDVASIVNAAQEMAVMTDLHPVLRNGLMHKNVLFENNADDCAFDALLSLLQKNTFKGEATFFALSGRVLAAYELMQQSKNEFASCLEALGELDALLSIAKLYKKMKHEVVSFSFAEYIMAEKPMVSMHGFWHPLIAPDIVVTNDIMLDQKEKSVILTGSNTGGKSTILKSIALSILFAQTLTIAPVQKISLTPFAYIGSYLHIQDNIVEGNSLFKAQVLSAQALIEKTNNLTHNQFGFVVMDELFTGTASEKGAQAAYKVAERLSQNPHLMYVLATHFPLLTTLETNNTCVNYKVDVIKCEDGTIIRPFKLERGISTTNIAEEILHAEINDINFTF